MRVRFLISLLFLGGCGYLFEGRENLSPTSGDLNAIIVGLSDPEQGQPLSLLAVVSTEKVSSYYWNFGDGSTGSISNPVHTFYSEGIFPVVLTVKDYFGRSVSVQTFVSVRKKNLAPTLTISVPPSIAMNLSAQFSVAVTDPNPEDKVFTYLWDFGDGGTSNLAAPTHTYTSIGPRRISVRVTDPRGLSTMADTLVAVEGNPSLVVNIATVQPQNEGTSVAFAGSVAGNIGSTTYEWNFGDGGTTSGTLTPSHIFVDNLPGNQAYTVSLKVTDSTGNQRTATTSVIVNNVAPIVSVPSISVTTLQALATNFTATVSDPGTNDTRTYFWVFSDGGNSTSLTTSHTFANVGAATATLTVTDKDGGQTSVQISVTVNPPLTVSLPAPGPVNEGGSLTFAGNIVGGLPPFTILFEFGDGSTASQVAPTHVYANSGSYTAKLTVTDATGVPKSHSVPVSVANLPPTASLPATYTAIVGAPINFNPTVSDPSITDRNSLSFLWDFADGTPPSTVQIPSHPFAVIGIYNISLRVTDPDGGFVIVNSVVNIKQATQAGDYIVTPTTRIPNFGFVPTLQSANTGPWSSPATWTPPRVPVAGDIVAITSGKVVTYDVSSTEVFNTVSVRAGGRLRFSNSMNTKMTVTNFMVLEGGTLEIGTAASPIPDGFKAEVVFAGAVDTTIDPEQFGLGLIGLGTVTIQGADRAPSFVRLNAELAAGQTSLVVKDAVSNWKAGDKLLLPDSRQLAYWFSPGQPVDHRKEPHYEEVTYSSVSADGKTVTLSSPIQYNHIGARDGAGLLEFLPHVGNLTRNVIIRSQDPTGERGYFMFNYQAAVSVKNAEFRDLGRSLRQTLIRTVLDSSFNVVQFGTNQPLRNPVVFNNVTGGVFEGNSVHSSGVSSEIRNGIVLYASPSNSIRSNVVFNFSGSGIVLMTSQDTNNNVESNFVVGLKKALDGDIEWIRNDTVNTSFSYDPFTDDVIGFEVGYEGAGVWLRSISNYVRNNIVSGAAINGYAILNKIHTAPMYEFSNNEAYGAMAVGAYFGGIGLASDDHLTPLPNQPTTTFTNLTLWHTHDVGFYLYDGVNLVVDGLKIRGNTQVLSPGFMKQGTTGIGFRNYLAQNIIFRNADVQGEQYGFTGVTTSNISDTLVENSRFKNYVNIRITPLTWYSNTGERIPPRKTIFKNTIFSHPTIAGMPNMGTMYDAKMDIFEMIFPCSNLIVKDELFIYEYNGLANKNFQIYYFEQAPTFVIPQSISSNPPGSAFMLGSPQPGITNQAGWNAYEWRYNPQTDRAEFQIASGAPGWNRLAFAGAVSPPTATQTEPEFYGFARPF